MEVNGGSPAVFSRLFFEVEHCVAMTPKIPDTDIVVMNYEFLVDTFKTCFAVLKPNECYALKSGI